jgi:uncharacterized membrane protein YqgA involved in biofilm formation
LDGERKYVAAVEGLMIIGEGLRFLLLVRKFNNRNALFVLLLINRAKLYAQLRYPIW